jgi:hypothetical protein
VQPTDKAPVPDTAERIASTPVEATDQPKTADVATPEQTDTPSPDSTPVPEQPAAAPEKTVTAVTPDAKPAEDIAPQLAPTTSPRPPARPKTLETPPEETQTADPAPDPAATDTAAVDPASIDGALALLDAPAPDTAATTPAASQTGSGGTGDQPISAALNSGEIDNLRRVIVWNIGSLSTEAQRVIFTMRVHLTQNQKVLSLELVDFTGGSAEAAQQAFESARRAVMIGANKGFKLPPDNTRLGNQCSSRLTPAKGAYADARPLFPPDEDRMTLSHSLTRLLGLAALCLGLTSAQLAAQTEPHITFSDPVIEPMPYAVPDFVAENAEAAQFARDLARVVADDLTGTGLFREIPAAAYISGISDFKAPSLMQIGKRSMHKC